MYLVGLIDDIYDLKPYIKLAGQIVAAGVVTFYGITIDFISLPMGLQFILVFLAYRLLLFGLWRYECD